MATIRRAGFGTVFELEDSKVGIGTDAATHTLQALGNIRSEDATDIGISSLTTYQGFVDKEARFTTGKIDNQSQSGSTSGEIVIDGDVTVSSATTFTSGPQNLTVTDTFTLPSGDTNSRELKPTTGSLRFNQDFATLEFYTGNNWATVKTLIDIKTNPQGRGRGVFMGGNTPSQVKNIDFVNISSLGNAIDFGLLSTGISQSAGSASEVRGLSSGGWSSPTRLDINEYITIASEGNTIDFGNLTQGRSHPGACNSSTRSLVAAGYGPNYRNEIDYVEIATIGNSVDFGDTTLARDELTGLSSPTRGIFAAGGTPSQQNLIEFVTISSKGNATKFGELTIRSSYACGGGNGIRGIIIPGNTPSPSGTDPTFIDQITIASEGNAVDFGGSAVTIGTNRGGSGCSKTRMVFGSGANPSINNALEFIVISSNGNAEDFGDLTLARTSPGGLSDSNGGLGGY